MCLTYFCVCVFGEIARPSVVSVRRAVSLIAGLIEADARFSRRQWPESEVRSYHLKTAAHLREKIRGSSDLALTAFICLDVKEKKSVSKIEKEFTESDEYTLVYVLFRKQALQIWYSAKRKVLL